MWLFNNDEEMIDFFEYIFLAIIQGITEFLPVSSSGHIEISKHFFNNSTIQNTGAFTTVILHLATALSIIFIFREKLKRILFVNTQESKFYLLKIIISIIPVFILVIFNIDELIENQYNNGWNLSFLSLMFLITGLILFITEKINIKTKSISFAAALLIGVAQAIAILPGISRSGATICCALLLGATKKEASSFSFIICLPIIIGKSFKDLFFTDLLTTSSINLNILLAFIVTFIIGLLCCKLMISIVNQSKLKYFGVYCILISFSSFLVYVLK